MPQTQENDKLINGGHTPATKQAPKSKETKHSSEEDENDGFGDRFTYAAIAFQVIFIILYAIFVKYPRNDQHFGDGELMSHTEEWNKEAAKFNTDYAMYQDVHVMMFIGFGFLMTFLRRYSFGSISFNFMICVFVIQWSLFIFNLIVQELDKWQKSRHMVNLNLHTLLDADLASAVVLISFGAILGRSTPLQLLIMAFIEVPIYAVNFYICSKYLKIVDVGGSIVVHTFGAYFGLGVSFILGKPSDAKENKSMYHSDLFAMIGSLFLWLFWPSFNGYFATVENNGRERAYVNTVIALSSGTFTTFIISRLINKGKFDMVHIQNSTLAGGVAIGAAADLYVHPVGAMVVGIIAAIISVLGYAKLHGMLEAIVFDTCGVHNLHGLPGILGAIVSAIVIERGSDKLYQYNTLDENGNIDYNKGKTYFPQEKFSKQARYQIIALIVTLSISIIGGLLTGIIIKNIEKVKNPFNDMDNFELPDPSKDIYRATIRNLAHVGMERDVMQMDMSHEREMSDNDNDNDNNMEFDQNIEMPPQNQTNE